MCVCVCLCVWVLHMCGWVRGCVGAWVGVFVCVCGCCIHVCVCVCMCLCAYTYTHTHTHIDGCLVRWIVEDDADRSAAAKQDIAELQLEDVRVVASSRYEDVLGDRFVRVVILAGPQEAREARAKSALSAGKHVLCERPIAFTLHSAKEVFDLARSKQAIFMPMLPGRPGKAFSAVVMSLFSSSEMIECQRKLPDDFKAPKQEAQDDKALLMLFADIAMQDIFAVNFSICMRPLSVTARRIASQEHSVEVSVTYPNRLVYTVRGGFGQDKIDTQLFKLTGEALNSMRRVDHMHDDRSLLP